VVGEHPVYCLHVMGAEMFTRQMFHHSTACVTIGIRSTSMMVHRYSAGTVRIL
jgi:hypothetical protein